MGFTEAKEQCKAFVAELEKILGGKYELMPSCNQDESIYLVPEGTTDKVTYYGKPIKSFRYSDHWNWYSSTKRCYDYYMVQCNSVDVPWARRRIDERATKPIFAVQVALVGMDGLYHCVYGYKFDRKTKTWSWVDAKPQDVAKLVLA